jgi:hypothetical protein
MPKGHIGGLALSSAKMKQSVEMLDVPDTAFHSRAFNSVSVRERDIRRACCTRRSISLPVVHSTYRCSAASASWQRKTPRTQGHAPCHVQTSPQYKITTHFHKASGSHCTYFSTASDAELQKQSPPCIHRRRLAFSRQISLTLTYSNQ